MPTYIDKKDFNIYYSLDDIRIQAPLFEVDEFIAPVISLLNKKGYTTLYCCSGYWVKEVRDGFQIPNNFCYITFKNKHQFRMIPFDSIVEYEGQKMILRINYDEADDLGERMVEIFNTMNELYDWAESLPSIRMANNYG